MITISKRETGIAARPKREKVMNIPSAGDEHKTRKMREGGKLVMYRTLYIYICIYIKYTYIFLYLFI